jgi:rhomboid protease GluP
MRRKAPITMALLVIIAIVFAFEFILGGPRSLAAGANIFIDDVNPQLLAAFGAIVGGTLGRHEYWRLFAAMFLHASILHWAVNSWALYQLGTLYEVLFGSRRFILIYLATGLCASIASAAHMHANGASVGASGAIFGILGAFIFSIRRSPIYRHQPWTRGLIGQLVFWIVVNVAIGASVAFIDNTAHLGGLISGLLLGLIPHRVPPPPPRESVIDVGTFDQQPR